MLGVQIPILLALFEYGAILAMKKYDLRNWRQKPIKVSQAGQFKSSKNIVDYDELAKSMDKITLFFSFGFIVLFNIVYWTAVKCIV